MAYTIDAKTVEQVKQFLIEYHKKNQKTPQFIEVEKALKLEHNVVRLCFRYLSDNGFFKRNYSQYKFEQPVQQEQPKTLTEQVKEKIKKLSLDDIFIGVLRVIMLLVGVGAIIMLSLFTYTWGVDHLENNSFAFVLSITLIVFSVCAFQVAVIYSQNGQTKMAVVYFITWLVVLLFSMQASVSYMYNTSNKKEIQTVISSNDVTRENMQWNELLKRESEKEVDIKKLKDRLDELNNILNQFNTPEKINADRKTYDDTNKKVNEQEKKIMVAEKELTVIRDDKDKILSKEQKAGVVQSVKRDDFYTSAGKLLRMESDALEFIVSCFPAIFFDVIAPLSISVALFLKRREKQKSKIVGLLEKIFIRKRLKEI
jgi:hypothetical protein